MAEPCILLTAAEASGDTLGAGLMRALKRRLPEGVRFVGVGGPQMQAEGLASVFDISELSVMGFLEGLLAYRRAKGRASDVAALAQRERPDAAVLIDSWGFSYLTAKALRRAMPDLPLVKYVAPQVWATRSGRAKALAELFDHLLSIVPFDRPCFEGLPVETTFVGHPALSGQYKGSDGERLRAALEIPAQAPLLLILLGSRKSEIARVGPPLLDAAKRLKNARPNLELMFAAAPTVVNEVRQAAIEFPALVSVVENETDRRAAMSAATAALACSGTVTTELAMAGCPMVVAYRLSPLTYEIAHRIVRIPYASLINLAAGVAVAPEYLQEACTGANLAGAMAPMLDDPEFRASQVAAQNRALDLLGRGGPDPSERSAEVLIEVLSTRAG